MSVQNEYDFTHLSFVDVSREFARGGEIIQADKLPRRGNITVNLDYKQMGIGGDDSWGARTHPEYTLPPKSRSYRFCLRPYTPAMGKIKTLARRKLLNDNNSYS